MHSHDEAVPRPMPGWDRGRIAISVGAGAYVALSLVASEVGPHATLIALAFWLGFLDIGSQ